MVPIHDTATIMDMIHGAAGNIRSAKVYVMGQNTALYKFLQTSRRHGNYL